MTYKQHLATLIPTLAANVHKSERISNALQFVQGWLMPNRGLVEAVQPLVYFSHPNDTPKDLADQVYAWIVIQDAWARTRGGEPT